MRGRGTPDNPPNRFLPMWQERDPEWNDPDDPGPQTQFACDETRSILSWNDSPDIPFRAGVNPYRGCEHGCVYCFARPTHEYLGFSAGLDFETRIVVKERAPELLRKQLASPRWEPQVIALSGNTDPYQPAERRFRLTRGCLEVLRDFRNPVAVITKNHTVTRDADLLGELAAHEAATVSLSITTLDPSLTNVLEPRTSRPHRRLAALRTLSEAGVPTGVMVAPVIPGLNDHEIPAILAAAREAGARHAGFILVRLPHAVRPLFEAWLREHRPNHAEKVLSKLRELRGGRLNDPRFHSRQRGEGPQARVIEQLFRVSCQRLGFEPDGPQLSTAAFRRPGVAEQLELFGQ